MKRAVANINMGAQHASAAPNTRAIGSAMFCDLAWSEIRRSLRFSERELEIVRRLFDDEMELAIATNLGIATRTVHTHVERLYRKLGITDRAQLLVHVMQEFLALTVCPDTRLPPICANRAAGRCPLQR